MRLFLTVCYLVDFAQSANILAIFPTPLYSHQSVFRPIWTKLAERGHTLTVLTTDPIKDIKNVKQIDLSFSYKLVYEDLAVQNLLTNEYNAVEILTRLADTARNMTEEQLKHPQVANLLTGDHKFDLLLVEMHVPSYFAFGEHFNCPIIGVTSLEAEIMIRELLGNYVHPVINFHFNVPFAHDLNFWNRLGAVLFKIFDWSLFNYQTKPLHQRIVRKYFNRDFDIVEAVQNFDLVLSNVIPGFTRPSTKIPNIVEFHGLHIEEPKVLPKDLQDFLDGANQGFIYFSLGSTVRSLILKESRIKVFLNVFETLPFKVIWKFEDDVGIKVPENVRIVNWTQQQDILRHSNIKLFITQGGIQSLEEAIRSCVPILGIPVFGDQFYNIERVKKLRIGGDVQFSNLNELNFKEAIVDIISNKTYKENLRDLADIIKSHPVEPLDKVIWWIEYVIRHKGASHLKSSLRNMPFYKYYLFDVVAFLLVSIFIVFFATKKILEPKRSRKIKGD